MFNLRLSHLLLGIKKAIVKEPPQPRVNRRFKNKTCPNCQTVGALYRNEGWECRFCGWRSNPWNSLKS